MRRLLASSAIVCLGLTTFSTTGAAIAAPLSECDKLASAGRTRPLCLYPAWPRYKGTGDLNAASSFVCTTE
jgi:hypothetical protein